MKCPNCDSPFESTSLFTKYANKWGDDNTAPIYIEKTNSIEVAMRKLRRKAIDVCFNGDEYEHRMNEGYDDSKVPKGYWDLVGKYGTYWNNPSLYIDVCVKCNTTGEISSDLNEYFTAIEKMSKKIDSLVKKKAKALEKKKAATAAKKKKKKEAEKIRLKKRLKELEKE